MARRYTGLFIHRKKREQEKAVQAAISKAKRTDKKEKSSQDCIPYLLMRQDGICQVTRNHYTKTIQFRDINYQLSDNEDKQAIFDSWCDFLNYFDSSVSFQLSFINLTGLRGAALRTIPVRTDQFESIQRELSGVIQNQQEKGNNGIVKTKYLTFGIDADSVRSAKPRLERIETDIFCRTKDVAERTKCAVTLWLKERLKLEISEKKTRIVNVRNHYSEFLGFKMKVHRKGDKLVVMSHIADKNLEHKREKLKEQAKRIVHPCKIYGEQGEIRLYNSMVTGMQNYYCIATHVNHDCASLNRTIMTLLTNRLSTRTGNRLVKKGRELTAFEKARFGKSKMIRYVAGTNEPIYPIGYTQHKNPLFRKKSWNYYTPEGREGIHDCLRINVSMMLALMRMPTYSNSAEYADNRISLFSAQWGKCAVTGDEFSHIGEIHCHHKLPRHLGGDDSYGNLVLIKDAVHKLIHASNTETIHKYMDLLQLDSKRLDKVNNLRQLASMQPI